MICPVCGFAGLEKGPTTTMATTMGESVAPSFETCPSCGFEFGFHDGEKGISYEAYRKDWIDGGCKWWDRTAAQPPNWDPITQLRVLLGN
jgi:hypothetical protein